MICVPCTTCAKDQGLFYLNYPQISAVENSDHMETTQLDSSHICWKKVRVRVRVSLGLGLGLVRVRVS